MRRRYLSAPPRPRTGRYRSASQACRSEGPLRWPLRSTSIESRAGHALVYFALKAVQLRPTPTRDVLPRIEKAYPQPSGPGVLDLGLSPHSSTSYLVGRNEVLGLRDRSRPRRGPHGGCQANNACFRLSDHAVPVVNSKRDPRDPCNVLRFPIAVTDAHRRTANGEPIPYPPSRLIDPGESTQRVEVVALVVYVRPQQGPGMVPPRPWRRWRECRCSRWIGRGVDEAGEEGRKGCCTGLV